MKSAHRRFMRRENPPQKQLTPSTHTHGATYPTPTHPTPGCNPRRDPIGIPLALLDYLTVMSPSNGTSSTKSSLLKTYVTRVAKISIMRSTDSKHYALCSSLMNSCARQFSHARLITRRGKGVKKNRGGGGGGGGTTRNVSKF